MSFVKIRSLPTSTPSEVDKYEVATIKNSAWGRFLRRHHLDELPQIWLVVAGKMSLVGPRPEMPTLAAKFEPAFAEERTLMKPGCTGLWQVSGRNDTSYRRRVELDATYVRNWTLGLDLRLVCRTVSVVLNGKGAY